MHSAAQWRVVYLVPAIVGLVISFVALLVARETDAFVESRLAYLNMTDEELQKAKEEKSGKNEQGSFIKGLKFALKHHQLR
jgi:hypothetical protein